jgi:BirA family biotin operon repressor/biotin-[acetyl-CoA-carboxylase] ligase
MTLDARDVETRTGWRVVARGVVDSTNDVAARLRDAGADERTVVVADRQTAGRGRGGHSFSSPAGGLYASLLLRVNRADLSGPVVAAAAVAVAEALESVLGVPAEVKWPNDVRVGGKKIAGLLLETGGAPDAGSRAAVIVGLGINVARVPVDLPPDVAAATTATDLHAAAPVAREDLLVAVLRKVDARVGALDDPARRAGLREEYRRRIALRGARVRFYVGTTVREGRLLDADLDRGLLVEPAAGSPVWHPAAHVLELREA